ncbi:ATP-binding protein [Rhodococcus ruber]|uniref:ATP-binding protein n=1 Tax=Rhodococcus ruber TaxID=1830 RepID=UPI0007439CAF|nr:ATP-binding protein [Rhodococcus ruber]MDO1481117.1 ATP-binding protein [Rhodococcus ruber]RQM32832.1 hypothetical protein TN91_18175 [Rhodococcus ruber]
MHRHPLDPSITSTVCWYRQAPATAAEITSLRRALAGWLARIGVDDRCRQDVVAAVYEALTTHTRVSTAGTGTTVTMSWQADLPV